LSNFLNGLSEESRRVWMAAWLDTEGCVSIVSTIDKKNTENRTERIHLRVFICQKIKEPLDILKEVYGGCISKHKQSDIYSWGITAWKAIRFLYDVYPYLLIKKRQADIAFRFFDTFKTIWGGGPIPGGPRVPIHILEERKRCKAEMREINSPNWRGK
jgi:hypothetical protein